MRTANGLAPATLQKGEGAAGRHDRPVWQQQLAALLRRCRALVGGGQYQCQHCNTYSDGAALHCLHPQLEPLTRRRRRPGGQQPAPW